MKKISIRQPGYIPFLGFFKKIESVDEFVILDDVQYTRSGWDNRNRIKTQEGELFLTIPILNKTEKFLNQVEIDYTQNWVSKHKSTIKYNYEHTPFFELYWNDLEKIIDKQYKKLIDLNMALINYFISILEIKTKTVYSSELKIDSVGSEKLLDICQFLNATTYVSGEFGQEYLNTKIFNDVNIKIIFEEFQHPQYSQKYSNFLPNMSIIDLLFNEGKNAINILKDSKNF